MSVAGMIVILSVMFLLFAGVIQPVSGQEDLRTNTTQTADRDATGPVRFSLDVDSPFGLFTLVPGHWSELHFQLENAADVPRELLCTSYFEGQPTLQFGRRVWVPPRTRLSLSHPVRLPPADEVEGNTAVVHSLVVDGTAANEVLFKNESGQLRHDRSLLLAPGDRHSAVVAGWTADQAVQQDVLDVLVASRVTQGLNTKVTTLAGHFLPADETSLGYLDHIVIADTRLTEDQAALSAVRNWLHAGGRLWIMLDRADPMILERLFGDGFQGHIVDRVGLTSVRIDVPPSPAAPDGRPGVVTEHEEPVQLARLVISDMKIWNTVNGWPAALSMDYGQGRVLITTLAPAGWIKPVTSADSRTPADQPVTPVSDYAVLSPMEDLSAYILAKRDPVPIPLDDLESIAQEYVAYSVPTFGRMTTAMGSFLVLLAAVGIWLWRSNRLEHFGWSGSLLAVLFALLLTSQGVANHYRVPEMMASQQIAQSLGGTDDVRTYGATAVYRTGTSDAPIQTAYGGELWPETSGMEGATLRMVTTDLDAYRWEGLPQSAGLRIYPHADSRSFSDRIAAKATIDAQGVAGQVLGLPSTGENAMLATRQGRVNVTLQGDGRFRAPAEEVLETDQYLAATFLGDVEDRRRRILQKLFENANWVQTLKQPMLMTWLNDWDSGFQFGDGLERQGDTLIVIPLEMTRPPAGTTMVIPSPLISFSSSAPPDGSNPSGFWDDNSREWQERSSRSTTWLNFQVPRGLLPLQATGGRMDIDVSGAMGRLEILGVREGEVVSLESATDPAGSLSFDIDDARALEVSDQGTLTLGISAGVATPFADNESAGGQTSSESSPATPVNYWRIESLSLQLSAQSEDDQQQDSP